MFGNPHPLETRGPNKSHQLTGGFRFGRTPNSAVVVDGQRFVYRPTHHDPRLRHGHSSDGAGKSYDGYVKENQLNGQFWRRKNRKRIESTKRNIGSCFLEKISKLKSNTARSTIDNAL